MNSKLHLLISSVAASFVAAASPVLAQSPQDQPAANNNKMQPCPGPGPAPTPAKRPHQAVQCFEQGYELNREKFPAAYNAPARIDVRNCWDLFISGSFIYWFVGQDGMDLAYPSSLMEGGPLNPQNAALLVSDTKYHPGFKVALGADFDFDNWVGLLEYTWLHETTRTGTKAAPVDPRTDGMIGLEDVWVVSDWLSAPSFDTEATTIGASWRVRLDMLDAVLSRPYYQGRRLTVAPFGGLRALWLRQRVNVNMTAPALVMTEVPAPTATDSVHSWALGPIAGMQGHWLLGCGMRFEGDCGAGLLYTRYTKLSAYHDAVAEITSGGGSVTAAEYFSLHAKPFSAVRPMANMGLGMGWGSYFCRQDYHFDLSATYDFMVFWGQNMMRELLLNSFGGASAPGDLYMHGLTVNMRWDF